MKLNLLATAVCAAIALPAMAADLTYRNDIAPMFKKFCADCHTAEAGAPSMAEFKLDEDKYKKELKVGPRTDTYEHVRVLVDGTSMGAMMRRLDDGSNVLAKGKPGNMYKHLGETEAERAANLKIVKAWIVGEGKEWNLNRLNARGDVPGITIEQLREIKAKY